MANVTSALLASPFSLEMMTNLGMNGPDQDYVAQTVYDCYDAQYIPDMDMDTLLALYPIVHSVMCEFARAQSVKRVASHILQGVSSHTGFISWIVNKYACKSAGIIMHRLNCFESMIVPATQLARNDLKNYNISVIRGEFQKFADLLNLGNNRGSNP